MLEIAKKVTSQYSCISLFLLSVFFLVSNSDLKAATADLITSAFSRPVYATSPPGDYERLFVLEQHTGEIRILNISTGMINDTSFLDIGSKISGGNEQGLLGLTFHPDYQTNGYFYVNYTAINGDTKIARYQVSAGSPNIADPGSETIILTISQPFSNHNGGWIDFGPDDYLYIATGDGGSAGDPDNNGQNINSHLGKILRIDVDSASPYAIPNGNPFKDIAGADEIWHWGWRNPWRNSFDRATNEFYIADVGQGNYEEIDFQPVGVGGLNYGWRFKEGDHCFNPPSGCDPGGLTDPIHEYIHAIGCSVTGGYVYRGCAIPELVGAYFFAEYCAGTIWTFEYDGANLTNFQDRTTELGLGDFGVVSFAEDNMGELYIIYQGGSLYKIIPDLPFEDCNENNLKDSCEIDFGLLDDFDLNGIPDVCEGFTCGDADDSGAIDISDAVYLISYIFGGGPAPNPLELGDADCSGALDISDAVYLINFIFGGGPAPCASCP